MMFLRPGLKIQLFLLHWMPAFSTALDNSEILCAGTVVLVNGDKDMASGRLG